MNRRSVLSMSLAGVAGPALFPCQAAPGKAPPSRARPQKAVIHGMVKGGANLEDNYRIIRSAGFEGLEVKQLDHADERRKVRTAAEKAGLQIHSMIFGWGKFDHPDPKVRQEAVDELKDTLGFARAVGADNVLVVPGSVNANSRYADVYARSQTEIRKAIPTAKRLGVTIAIEDVGNNFLLSPLEFNRYIDELDSPWVKGYFDVGNIVRNGWPADWIRTLGRRINRVHLKDYKKSEGRFVRLREGDVDWKEVRQAFLEVGWPRFVTAEFEGGDLLEPHELARRMDEIIDGGAHG